MLDFVRFRIAGRRTNTGAPSAKTRAEKLREYPDESPLLRDTLRVCQEELARVRASQETLMEDLAREHLLRTQVERQGTRLAEVVEEHLLAPPSGPGVWARVRRRVRRARLARAAEWRVADEVAGSSLFSSAWYIRRYPEVLTTGLPPALHFVRHGAPAGKDPSSRFSTKAYLQAHPDVRASGENPLIHHLRTDQDERRDR